VEKREAIERADADYQEAAVALSQIVLGPVAGQLLRKRIVIVADGSLEYVPFGALPAPVIRASASPDRTSETSEKAKVKELIESGGKPLIVDHEIVKLPSASALAVLRRELAGRKVAPKLVAVLADPVFDKSDPRLGPTAGKEGDTAVPVSSTDTAGDPVISSPLISPSDDVPTENGKGPFPRLPFSRLEAKSILSSCPPGSFWRALDFDANKAMATSPKLNQFRIVHFATHGLLNNRHPELSGLVFSLFDQKGDSQDGVLQLNEIYNLNLSADLVVLSACQTALGKEIRREGIVGLTSGFMYAGAARVMASLWKVDDEATADLMQRFYYGVLRRGLTPAAALRSAEVAMWKEGKWRSPFYWAGFVVYGEWQ
ncbi:MAG TPA: CHAT domain-containing protein, partial [Blastocatellia bacterium]|nr:CHAT domain-containing protein [Blastocatellia bacterium]